MTTAIAPAPAPQFWWRPMARAMGQTAAGSMAGGLLGAAATKIAASMLGPGPVALLNTLQQLRDGAVTASTANGRTALVQGISSLEGVDRSEYVRTVAVLFAAGITLVAAVLAASPSWVARGSRLPPTSGLLPWIAITVALLSGFVFLSAILNSLREIGRLAMVQVASPLIAASIAWPLAAAVRAGHTAALPLFLAIPAAGSLLLAGIALRGHRDQMREWWRGAGRWWSLRAARTFFSISGAMMASSLVTTLVLLGLRGAITRRQGLAITGQFDAAWNISMNQVTLILGSVQAYYLPTLAASKSPHERSRQIRGMLLLATLTTVPVIVALETLKPLAVDILYSPAFQEAPRFLRWTLLGDYLKVSSWVLATPMLATRDIGAFLWSDLAAQAVFLASALLLARRAEPAEAVAMGFLISYAIYAAVAFWYARIRHGFRLGSSGLRSWFLGLALILAASASTWSDTSLHLLRASCWILLALGCSTGFALHFRRSEA